MRPAAYFYRFQVRELRVVNFIDAPLITFVSAAYVTLITVD